jgi:dCMP deaminase
MKLTNRDRYYMDIASSVRGEERDPAKRPYRGGANCLTTQVGAVLVRDDRIISTGYNGTPADMPNCHGEHGCVRCEKRDELGFESGQGLDRCLCVHAEQNALLTAARFGIAVDGSTLYSTTQPCFGCLKEALQSGVDRIVYAEPYAKYEPLIKEQYDQMVAHLKKTSSSGNRAFENLIPAP